MSQVNFADKIVYLHNIEHYKSPPPPYNTTLGSRESWFRTLDQYLPQL